MKKKRKDLWKAAVLTAGLLMMPVPMAMADTISFDITIPSDTMSRKANKADNEQNFYVTGTSFNYAIGILRCYSCKYSGNVFSNITSISQSSPASSASYTSYADANQLYFMNSYSENASDFHVLGRYTP